MMKKNIPLKKGQTALEYLMTYGRMIIIIGVAGVFLWQTGIFTPQTTPPGCTGFSQVKPADWKASYNDGNLTLTLFNDAGTKVNISYINASIFNVSCTGNPATIINPQMRSGEYRQVFVSGCSYAGVGEYYKADIIVVYTNVASSIGHNSVGECHGTTES